jgi:hypothetical protein
MDVAMPRELPASFHNHFRDLKDPRVQRTLYHPLINVLFIAVCGVLSGANSFAAVHEFGVDRHSWLARFLDLRNGIACEDSFRRVLARLDPAAFEKALLSRMQAVQESTANRSIAIDGKTLRGSYHRQDDGVVPLVTRGEEWATVGMACCALRPGPG